jgi:hypothetical protein
MKTAVARVDGFDLTAFRNAFGSVQGNASYVPFLDFNGDGAIDGADLTQFRFQRGGAKNRATARRCRTPEA